MTVMSSSGMAGSGSMIRLRGNTSMTMTNQPLVYVDGIRIRSTAYALNVPPSGSTLRGGNDVASPLNDINPADIERIEVIKGAAAATLYGTEAAAGVIQIFTKNGHTGKPQWTAQIEQGFAHELKFGPDPSKAPPGDTIYSCTRIVSNACQGTMQAYRDSFPDRFNGLPTVGVSRAGGTSSYLFIDPWLRDAYQQRYSLSVGGGGESLRYFVSGTLTDEDAILPNDNEKRSVIRGNFTFSPISTVLFSWNTSYTKDKISNTAAGNNAHGITLNAFRRDRNYASDDRPEIVEKMLNQEITSEIDHLISGGSVSWSPITNMTNKLTIGYDLAQVDNRNVRPFGFVSAPTGIISDRRHTYQTLTFDYVGSYIFNLTSDVNTTVSWGGQSVTTDTRETSAYGDNFPGPFEATVSGAGLTLGFEERTRIVNAGFFGQALFDLKDRYFFTVGARVDGNSAFGSDFGIQAYPKASFSWVMSDEAFFPQSAQLKLRAALGQAGRAPGAFDAVRTWDPTSWGSQPGFFPSNVGNPDLGPERTTEIEAGFDASVMDNRVSGEFTWYHKRTTDALFDVRQIPTLGFLDEQLDNVGELTNKGIEASLEATVLRTPKFQWTLGASLYTDFSKVETLGNAVDFSLGDNAWVMVGQPAPVIRANRCVTNPDERAAPIIVTHSDSTPCLFGPNLPTHTWGASTMLQLPAGITFVARAEYMTGHYMQDGAAYNAVTRSVRWPGCYEFYNLQESGRIAEAKAIDRARCTVSSACRTFPLPCRLREAARSVAQHSSAVAVPRGRATSARLTLAGHNLWKWVNKDFPVFDPETGATGFNNRVRSILEHVPPPATYTASLRVTF
jgi:TonB-dependent SusC/RagA subfamily outer membrane receptor